MTINPRFTNAVIKSLQNQGIDLFALTGAELTDHEKRVAITVAACPVMDADQITSACDNMTPGEHIEILLSSIKRDLVPASQREATATAATDKSQP